MDRLRKLWQPEQSYAPLHDEAGDDQDHPAASKPRFSYVEYAIFLLLGVSMLWAWNMFLAAGPYFQHRFRENDWIEENFQAAEISVSTVTNLGSMLILTKLQANANYPRRIVSSLVINMAVFTLLAISTKIFTSVSASAYFGFLMVMMFSTSLATGLCQNGIFAFVSGYGEPRYTAAIMLGQAIAGVLPCILEIVSVQAFAPKEDSAKPYPPVTGPPPVNATAALSYFLTATVLSVTALLAFFLLLARRLSTTNPTMTASTSSLTAPAPPRTPVPFTTLFRKLSWLASAVFVTFGITMLAFPVFTQQIISNRPTRYPASTFIPLAFLFWNIGDLFGRLMTGIQTLSLVRRPRALLVLAVCRVAFVGGYYLCNIRGRGAVIPSDVFYLVVIQLFFGLTNGYLGSTCMIGAAGWVDEDEREAAGGFMGLCLVTGLTAGSLGSFFLAGA